jgi:hypothetical protein
LDHGNGSMCESCFLLDLEGLSLYLSLFLVGPLTEDYVMYCSSLLLIYDVISFVSIGIGCVFHSLAEVGSDCRPRLIVPS